jgi:hypothetical protein
LVAFTHSGDFISSFLCGHDHPTAAAFDENRGLIAYSSSNGVRAIGTNRWLPDTYVWGPNRHRHADRAVRQVVAALTSVRTLAPESPVSLLPNELLFMIFELL